MAEERIIDDDTDKDKDKKYRFRIGEDGEEELVIDGYPEEEEPKKEEVEFDVPDVPETDDEEAAIMTPEQLAAKLAREEAERAEKEKRIADLLDKAKADCESEGYATALEYLREVEELSPENGEIYALRTIAYTRNFTDYARATVAAESADDLKEYTPKERRDEILAYAAPSLNENIEKTTAKISELDRENEEKKAERAVRFLADRKRAIKIFACVAAPFAVFLALGIFFASIMFSVTSFTYIALAIIFGSLTLVAFVLLIFASRGLNTACRRVRLNGKNTSTKLGRELIENQNELEALKEILAALSYVKEEDEEEDNEEKAEESEKI